MTRQPNSKCLGRRNWDPITKKWGLYQWQDYGTIGRRRANLGAGLIGIHKEAGIVGERYGVGLWCQNRPEWQIVGEFGLLSIMKP